MRDGQLSPGFAIASLAVGIVAVAAVVWAVAGSDGPEATGGIAAVPATEAPAEAAMSTAALPRSTNALALARSEPGLSGPAGADGAAGPAGPPGAQGPSDGGSAAAATQVLMPAPTAMIAEVAVTRTAEEQMEAEEAPMAMATAMPQAASAPTQASAQKSAAASQDAASSAGGMGHAGQRASTAGGTPPDTTFRDYQRQPFVSASEDNISTFSLDTDRTSYHLALNWARNGFEVNPDSVRAEEWLNAFNYEYDPPSGGANFAIVSDLLPHPLDEGKRLARIAFQAPELVGDRPLNVTLVLDASGSMGDGNRVAIARAAAESIRQSLGDDDRIAVVHFTDDVIDRYTVGHGSPDSRQVIESISRLDPHGSTNVQAGLNLGVRMAGRIRDQRPDAYNYVILMSDGVANVDATDPFAILETAYDPDSRNPLRLITIGVGISNYNDTLLEQLAQHGNGWYRYLDTTEQAEATFARENWLALSTPFADQTRAQVTWNAGTVERWRIIGYENRVTADENFTQDRKEFAEIYSGTATTVLYELELSDSAQSLTVIPLGRVELRWMEPDSGDSRSQTANLSGDPGASFDGYDGSLAHFGAIVALAADLYSVLPVASSETTWEVHAGLSTLQDDLSSLRNDLGALDSYTDFEYLLEHMVDGLEDGLPPSSGSGYSR